MDLELFHSPYNPVVKEFNQTLWEIHYSSKETPTEQTTVARTKNAVKIATRNLDDLGPTDFRRELIEDLFMKSHGFLHEGTLNLKSEAAAPLIDYLGDIAYDLDVPLDKTKLAEITDILIGFLAGFVYGIDYTNFQTEISLKGQGVIESTYDVAISIFPQPRKLV